jgi:hypothetical protein
MIEEIKLMLGEKADYFSDAQIGLAYRCAVAEVETYCNRELDDVLTLMAEKIAVIKLNRINTEGISSQSFSGIAETYIDGYPAEVVAILDRKRKVKIL